MDLMNFESFGMVATRSFVEASRLIKDITQSNGMAVIVGPPGIGKTTLQNIAIGRYSEVAQYCVVDLKVTAKINYDIIGSVKNVMIDALLKETPRRDMIAKDIQLTRGLKNVSKSKRIILSIDEAQDLHGDSLYGLKKIHELGKSISTTLDNRTNGFLFSVVLFGLPSLLSKVKPRELGMRFTKYEMGAFNLLETKQFVNLRGIEFTERNYNNFFNLAQGNPEMSNKYIESIKRIMRDKNMDSNNALSFYATGDLARELKLRNFSYNDVSKWIYKNHKKNYDKSTIAKSVNGQLVTDTAKEIRNLANEMIDEHDKVVNG